MTQREASIKIFWTWVAFTLSTSLLMYMPDLTEKINAYVSVVTIGFLFLLRKEKGNE